MATKSITSKGEVLRVDGYKELRKGLKEAGEGLDDVKAAAVKALDPIVKAAQAGAPQGPTGRLRASIRGAATVAGARVMGGGPKAPHFIINEFGGTLRRFHSPTRTQFKPRSPRRPYGGNEGYFFFPAVREHKENTLREFQDFVDGLVKGSFHD